MWKCGRGLATPIRFLPSTSMPHQLMSVHRHYVTTGPQIVISTSGTYISKPGLQKQRTQRTFVSLTIPNLQIENLNMDTGNRYERDPRSGAQQTYDSTEGQGTEQWDNPTSIEQDKWEDRGGDTDRSGGDPYGKQERYGQRGYDEQGTELGAGGQQRSDYVATQRRTGAGTTSGLYDDTSGQYGGGDRERFDQTSGLAGPTTGSAWQGDRDDGTTGSRGPSFATKLKGTAEKIAGKVTGDPSKQARGQERQEGTY
ncbi:hypothetical protein BJV74DRAFT_870252 [Russula compacta]|nr:hypothetical protein BJV74DRAFT_870252 [Russula compacta]